MKKIGNGLIPRKSLLLTSKYKFVNDLPIELFSFTNLEKDRNAEKSLLDCENTFGEKAKRSENADSAKHGTNSINLARALI